MEYKGLRWNNTNVVGKWCRKFIFITDASRNNNDWIVSYWTIDHPFVPVSNYWNITEIYVAEIYKNIIVSLSLRPSLFVPS